MKCPRGEEVRTGFLRLLTQCRGQTDFEVRSRGNRVSFVLGVPDPKIRLVAADALDGMPVAG